MHRVHVSKHTPDMMKIKVLFLCTGNSARSQMAEAFLRSYAGDAVAAYSAGLEPKGINPLTIQVMHEIGIDMAGQRSKHLNAYLGKFHFYFVITVCGHADRNCPAVFPGAINRLHWDFEDPDSANGSESESLQRFRAVRDRIRERIVAWLKEIGIMGTE